MPVLDKIPVTLPFCCYFCVFSYICMLVRFTSQHLVCGPFSGFTEMTGNYLYLKNMKISFLCNFYFDLNELFWPNLGSKHKQYFLYLCIRENCFLYNKRISRLLCEILDTSTRQKRTKQIILPKCFCSHNGSFWTNLGPS